LKVERLGWVGGKVEVKGDDGGWIKGRKREEQEKKVG
jgi:hypothetical protein